MSSASFVLVIIGVVFGVLAGIGARRRREGVLLAGVRGHNSHHSYGYFP